jgi:hypothetical protein
MKIKIRLHSGKRISSIALPTVHPLLFVTPQRLKAHASPTGRAQFNEDFWAITHKPTGYAVVYTASAEEGKQLAGMLGQSKIPWEKLRSKKDAHIYASEFERVMKEFAGAGHP